MFIFNFIFWLVGAALIGVGTWSYIEKDRFDVDGARDIYDIIFDVSITIIVIGCIIFVIAFAGCLGALRENICLLKFFSYALGVIFLLEVVGAILAFVFSNEVKDMVTEKLQDEGIENYRDDPDFQSLIDWFQETFECCGVGIDGFRDWSKNAYFNCTTSNPSPERCGVPFSCCKRSDVEVELINFMCGYNTQQLSYIEAQSTIYTDGCVETILDVAEDNLYIVGGVAIGLAVPQILGIFLACLLARDIQDEKEYYEARYGNTPIQPTLS